MSGFWAGHQAGIFFFIIGLLVVALANLRAWKNLGDYGRPSRYPRVSVLVPVRNEQDNIGPCLASLLAQQYPDFEVIALDDHSTDRTGQALSDLAARDGRLRALKGSPLPAGWLGKHWACHQLAQAATGDLLLFTDADTRHDPRALADAVAALMAEEADLLTALPRQQVSSWGERLVVPIIPWSLFAILPLGLAHWLRLPALSATIGQFMLFRRAAYDRIGGYEAIRQHVADDLALGRRIKAHGLRWRLVDGGSRVSCRMYRTGRQALDGLSKNLFAAFGYRLLPFLFVWLWLGIVSLEPPLVVAGYALGLPGLSVTLAAATVLASLLLWGLIYRHLRLPLYLACLYPATICLAVALALRSLALAWLGSATWKGRAVGVR